MRYGGVVSATGAKSCAIPPQRALFGAMLILAVVLVWAATSRHGGVGEDWTWIMRIAPGFSLALQDIIGNYRIDEQQRDILARCNRQNEQADRQERQPRPEYRPSAKPNTFESGAEAAARAAPIPRQLSATAVRTSFKNRVTYRHSPRSWPDACGPMRCKNGATREAS